MHQARWLWCAPHKLDRFPVLRLACVVVLHCRLLSPGPVEFLSFLVRSLGTIHPLAPFTLFPGCHGPSFLPHAKTLPYRPTCIAATPSPRALFRMSLSAKHPNIPRFSSRSNLMRAT